MVEEKNYHHFRSRAEAVAASDAASAAPVAVSAAPVAASAGGGSAVSGDGISLVLVLVFVLVEA